MRRHLTWIFVAFAVSTITAHTASAQPSKKVAKKAAKPAKAPARAAPAKAGPAKKAPPAETTGGTASAPPPVRGPTRIDFDDRLVQGQTNKSGAVYLYDRQELKTRSMVQKRESFREEILNGVFGG